MELQNVTEQSAFITTIEQSKKGGKSDVKIDRKEELISIMFTLKNTNYKNLNKKEKLLFDSTAHEARAYMMDYAKMNLKQLSPKELNEILQFESLFLDFAQYELDNIKNIKLVGRIY